MEHTFDHEGPIELSPGFRFHPTDEELISDYLYSKICGHTFVDPAIGEVDVKKISYRLDRHTVPLQDIRLATNNFDEKYCIGRGGFGKVYKGELVLRGKSPATYAIKRLDPKYGQGEVEFKKEIMTLFSYKHENIVTLEGFSDEAGEKILVYEYLSNGSLDKLLSEEKLSVDQRLRILLRAAHALDYLDKRRLFHRDIKSSNILLDEYMRPKISDFGLSKFAPGNQDFSFQYTGGAGTYGYCDPVYLKTGLLTKESDIYSFGVVSFELLCARPGVDSNGQFLSDLAKKCYEENKIGTIVPDFIRKQITPRCLDKWSTIAYRCLNEDRNERPSIAEIIKEFEDCIQCQLN